MTTREKKSRLLMLLGIAMFATSLCLNAVTLSNSSEWPGWFMLVFGAFGLIWGFSLVYLPWLANLLLFITWILFYRKKWEYSVRTPIVAFLLAAGFILVRNINLSLDGGDQPITSLGLGYWIWLGSIAITIIATYIGKQEGY